LWQDHALPQWNVMFILWQDPPRHTCAQQIVAKLKKDCVKNS
jgi:hypothetical protein